MCYTCNFMAQVQTWAKQQAERIQSTLSALDAEREEIQRLLDWISSAEESLNLKEQEPLPEDLELTADLITQHTVIIANNNLFITLSLKKIDDISVLIYSLMSFQTCMTYFLLLRKMSCNFGMT